MWYDCPIPAPRSGWGNRIIVDTCIIAIVHDARAEDQNQIEVRARMAPKLFFKEMICANVQYKNSIFEKL